MREEVQREGDSRLQVEGSVLWSEERGNSQLQAQYGRFNRYGDSGVKPPSLQPSLPCTQPLDLPEIGCCGFRTL